MKTTRRSFLKATGVALAAPMVWVPSRAKAATKAFGDVQHLLVLFAKGGFRSHCLFNAVGHEQHNPFGAHEMQLSGTEWRLGAAAGDLEYSTSLGIVPGLARSTGRIAVLPCVDHIPGAGQVDVGHDTAIRRICTGSPYGANGLLSVIGRDHAKYSNGFSLQAVPPVQIRATDFGRGAADYAKTRPLTLQGGGRSFASQLPVGQGWKIGARDALNARFRDNRSRAYRSRLSEFLISKSYASTFSTMLSDPLLDVVGMGDAAAAGVTNRQLLEVLGNESLRARGDLNDTQSWGADVALALRFFQFGSPAVVVTRDIYDMHDDERTNFAPRAGDLARQLAGLSFLLERMQHPGGGTYWDKTMVVVVSEFSRNNTALNGFNSGNGSDHVGEASGPTRNQAVAVMGGMVTQGGKLIGSTDKNMNAQGKVFSSRSLLATCLDGLGMDPNKYWADAPIEELFV